MANLTLGSGSLSGGTNGNGTSLGITVLLLIASSTARNWGWGTRPISASFASSTLFATWWPLLPRFELRVTWNHSRWVFQHLYIQYRIKRMEHNAWCQQRINALLQHYLSLCYRDHPCSKNGIQQPSRHIEFYNWLSSCILWWSRFCLDVPLFRKTDKNENFNACKFI